MLSKLSSYFSARQSAIDRAPDRYASSARSDKTTLLLSADPPKKSTFRLSNDAGNDDPCAPPAQSFKLRIAKIPRQVESSLGHPANSPATLDDIRKESKEQYDALKATENLFSIQTSRRGRYETSMEKLLKGSEFAEMIDSKTGGFLDPSTGLCCQLQPLASGSYALCIPGIAPGEMFGTQVSASVQQFLGVGGVPEIYRQALKLAEFLNKKLEEKGGKKLELTGHSMGGGIANYVGLKLDLPSKCFNAAALGRACLKDIGEVSPETLKKQIHIRMENDFATHPPVTRKLMAFFSLGRERYIPRNIGVIYEIKTSDPYYPREQDTMGRHLLDAMNDWFAGALLSRLFA